MKEIILTDVSISIIVSTLIDAKIEAEKNNRDGIQDIYIECIEKKLEDLKKQTL